MDSRTRGENTKEAEVSEATSKGAPQLLNGKPYWAKHWGVTRAQCQALLAELQEMCRGKKWPKEGNVYKLVDDVIKPKTRDTGVGYALLCHRNDKTEPKEVTLMVSHAWAENAMEFLEACIRAATEHDVMFICALSLYQNEDRDGVRIADQLGAGPKASPFYQVLDHIKKARSARLKVLGRLGKLRKLLLTLAILTFYYTPLVYACVPTLSSCAFRIYPTAFAWRKDWFWEWRELPTPMVPYLLIASAVLFAAAAACWLCWWLATGNRMIVVPNREADIYARLWCVYEMFVARSVLGVPVELAPTFAKAGSCRSAEAECGNPVDRPRLHSEIVHWGRARKGATASKRDFGKRQELPGASEYDKIDRVVFYTTRSSYRKAAKLVFYLGLVYVFIMGSQFQVHHIHGKENGYSTGELVVECFGSFMGASTVVGVNYYTLKKEQGKVREPHFWASLLLLILIGLCFCFPLMGISVLLEWSGISGSLCYHLARSFAWTLCGLLLFGVPVMFLSFKAADSRRWLEEGCGASQCCNRCRRGLACFSGLAFKYNLMLVLIVFVLILCVQEILQLPGSTTCCWNGPEDIWAELVSVPLWALAYWVLPIGGIREIMIRWGARCCVDYPAKDSSGAVREISVTQWFRDLAKDLRAVTQWFRDPAKDLRAVAPDQKPDETDGSDGDPMEARP